MSLRVKFAWYDLWIGAFIERNDPDHRWIVYVCPLPTLLLILRGPLRWDTDEPSDGRDLRGGILP